MPHVMLRRDWPGTFARTVPGADRRLVFSPGDPVELNFTDLAAVAGDVGKALVPVAYVDGRLRVQDLTDEDRQQLQDLAKATPEDLAKLDAAAAAAEAAEADPALEGGSKAVDGEKPSAKSKGKGKGKDKKPADPPPAPVTTPTTETPPTDTPPGPPAE